MLGFSGNYLTLAPLFPAELFHKIQEKSHTTPNKQNREISKSMKHFFLFRGGVPTFLKTENLKL